MAFEKRKGAVRGARAAMGLLASMLMAALVAPPALARPMRVEVGPPGGSEASGSATGATEVRSDFNGDGYSDLAIGSTGGKDSRFIGTSGEGRVHVLYGSRIGLTAAGDQRWTQESEGIADTKYSSLGGDESGDNFGSVLATGDFDGDGFADLAIGSPGEHPLQDPRPHSLGAVHILYGSPKGLKGSNVIRWPAKVGIADGAIRFGGALTGGDFDGDGIDDLAIFTAWSHDFNSTPEDKVAVAILRGTPDGLRKVASSIWYEPGIGAYATQLASGDVDGDGIDDIALGIPRATRDLWSSGHVRVLFGDAADVGTRNVLLTQDTVGLARLPGDTDGAAEYEYFGEGLAIADFDSDGHGDLAIGAPGESVPGALCIVKEFQTIPRCPGAVTIIPGAADGLDLEASVVLAQGFDGLAGSSEPDDQFGTSLAAGDLNLDGSPDLAIGAPGETIDSLCEDYSDDYPTEGMCGHGAVTVVYGTTDGLVPSASSRWTLMTPGVPGRLGEFGYDGFGSSLAIGSFGRGRAADLAIGGADGDRFEGFVDVLYATTEGLSTEHAQLWSPSSDGVIGKSVTWNLFGYALAQ